MQDWLNNRGYNFEINLNIKNLFDTVLSYFTNRSKWKDLYRARDEILKLVQSYKENNPSVRESNKNLSYRSNINETDELYVKA